MYKLLIVDDEDVIRRGLALMIEERFAHAFQFLEAKNGEEALAIVRKQAIDLVLLDIKMPVMDGLEFVMHVRRFLPSLRMVILSGYGEFEYARQAITYHISEFLVKPVDSLKLHTALQSLMLELGQEREQAWNKIHEQLIHNEFTTFSLESMLKEYNIRMPHPFYCVIQLEIIHPQTWDRRMLSTLISRTLGENSHLLASHAGISNRTTIICNVEHDNVTLFAETVRAAVLAMENEHWNTIWGISRFSDHLSELQELYTQSCSALMERIIHSDLKFHVYQEVANNQNYDSIPELVISNFMVYLQKRMDRQLQQSIADLFHDWIQFQNLPVRVIIENMNHIGYQIAHRCMTGAGSRDWIHRELKQLQLEMDKCRSLNQAMQIFQSHLKQIYALSKTSHAKDQDHKKNAIVVVQAYIRLNFRKPLTLAMVSNQVSMSSSYFSVFFKRETGKSLIEYILDVRIENALNYLNDPNYKIYEIASLVGFQDEKYFYKVFRKKMGMTPKEYRDYTWR